MLIAGHEMSSCYAIVDSHKLEVLRLWFVLMRESNEEASVRLWMKFVVIVEGIQFYLKSFGRISIGSIYCETYFQVYTITLLSEIILFDQATYIRYSNALDFYFSPLAKVHGQALPNATHHKSQDTPCAPVHIEKSLRVSRNIADLTTSAFAVRMDPFGAYVHTDLVIDW